MRRRCITRLYNKYWKGAHSIFDDIIVHGASKVEHDHELQKVLETLSEKGLTLNLDKCHFNMPHVEFMGHILSEKGIGIADQKVKAVRQATQPQNASEVRIFLGLFNFSGRFIPNLATMSEPLRKLTRKNQPFVWTKQ